MRKKDFNKGRRFALNDGLDWDAKIEKWDDIINSLINKNL